MPEATRQSGGRMTRRPWVCADAGLPKQNAYMSVLREAMARDTLDPVGVTFGTSTGQVWHSADEGVVADDHRHAARDLGGRGRSSSTDPMATVLLPRVADRPVPGHGERHEVARRIGRSRLARSTSPCRDP